MAESPEWPVYCVSYIGGQEWYFMEQKEMFENKRTGKKSAVLGAMCPLIIAFSATGCMAAAESDSPELVIPEFESADIAELPAPGPHRVLVAGGFRDNGFKVIDGDEGKVVGQLYTVRSANLAIDPNDGYYYVADTTYSRGNRGAREDFIAIYDQQLKLVDEIAIPGRLIVVPKTPVFDLSSDGKRAFVYNMDPATSIIVVDIEGRNVAETVDIPGCGLVYPFGGTDFASLCSDGTLAVASIGGEGYTVTRTNPFFDAVNDPVFEESLIDTQTGMALFLTYTGQVLPVKLGTEPEFEAPWSLLTAAGHPAAPTEPELLAWRPGGAHFMGWHKDSGRLFVLMHPGAYWTHKEGGTEVWVFDINERKRVGRYPLEEAAESITVSQGDDPLLFVITGGATSILDANTGKVLRSVTGAGGGIPFVHGF